MSNESEKSVKYPALSWFGSPQVYGPDEVYFNHGRKENLHRLARCFMAMIRPDDEPLDLDTFTYWDSSLTPAEKAVGEALLDLFHEAANAGWVQPPSMVEDEEE